MRKKSRNLFGFVTVVLLICVTNVFVFGGVPLKDLQPASALATTGILSVFDMDSALVNGNLARNGTTVLSGSEIKTDKSRAKVIVNGLGSIDMAPDTTANLSFTPGQINLNVSDGQAELTALKGVKGVLTTADGEVLKTDPSLEDATVGTSAADPASAAKRGWSGWSTGAKVALVGGIIAGTAVIIYFATRDTSSTR